MPVSNAFGVREICDDDVEQVVALWRAAGVSRPYNDPHIDIAFARRGDHSTVLVGAVGTRIVATAMVGEDGHRGWIYYLATDERHRGAGYGKAMMEAAEAWLAARGVWKSQLLIRGDNGAVRQFYEAIGYKDTGVVCFQKVIGRQDPAS